MDIEYLSFSSGPQKVAPFSHAVRAGDYLFVTGQMPTLKNDNTKPVSYTHLTLPTTPYV